jgi:hypothetical protein
MTDINEDHNHADTELSQKAHDLVLHADNDSHLYKTSHVPVAKNLEKKMKKGVYDHEKAKTLWGYHADRAAQSWNKQHGHVGVKWHEHFPTRVRKEAASHWADAHHAEMSAGNYHIAKESEEDFAAEIVYSAMEKKPVELSGNFRDAVLERSRQLVDEKKSDLAGNFMEAFSKKKVTKASTEANPKLTKKGKGSDE